MHDDVPTELLVLRAQECKHRYPRLNRPKLAGGSFHRKIFRAYRRAMTSGANPGRLREGGGGRQVRHIVARLKLVETKQAASNIR